MYENPVFMKKVSANVEGRDFVVGDIHGCFEELEKLLVHVKFNPTVDRLFSTGDLIDRGPRSADCLSLLVKDWFYPVLGNHEDLYLNKFKLLGNNQELSLSYEEIDYIRSLERFIPDIMKMPLVYEVDHLLLGKFYIIHSEILPEHLHSFSEDEIGNKEYETFFNSMKKFDFSQQIIDFFKRHEEKILNYTLKQKILWSRKTVGAFYKDNKDSIDHGDFSFMNDNMFHQKTKVFCGHNVVPFPMKIGQQYYIDTGAALGHASKEINSHLFSQFGHEFFALSMIEVTTGVCYGCISSNDKRYEIMRLEKSLYENEIK
jgi:hypothetical protein